MLQSNFSFSAFKILVQNFFYRNPCKTVAEVLIIAVILFSANSASAHKMSSWEPYKSLFEQGECQKLISHLKPLPKPRNWYDNRMWSRSRILNSKCQMQLENYKAALKSLKQTPESEERDV